jgi:Spirocyclase AveC-like
MSRPGSSAGSYSRTPATLPLSPPGTADPPLAATPQTSLRVAEGDLPTRAAAPARRVGAIKAWATVGVIAVAVIAQGIGRWVASDQFAAAPKGPDHYPHLAVLRVVEVISALFLLYFFITCIVIPLRQRRGFEFDGMLLLGCLAVHFFDPLFNYFSPTFLQNAYSVNAGSWANFIPGYASPSGSPRLSISQALPVTPSERSSPEESDTPNTSASPLVHKQILWTRTAINPSKPRRTTTPRFAGVIAKLPANSHLLGREGNRFTRERSLVQAQPCPSRFAGISCLIDLRPPLLIGFHGPERGPSGQPSAVNVALSPAKVLRSD